MSDSSTDLMRALHDQHAGALLSYVQSLTNGDRARAQDVVQETLLRAWRHPHVLDQSERSARAWLFTVARHIVVDQARAERSRPAVTMSDPPEQPVSDDTDQILQRWVVTDALRQLSPDHQRVLVESFYGGHSVAETAARLGIPQGTVKSRTHYALHALRLALEERG